MFKSVIKLFNKLSNYDIALIWLIISIIVYILNNNIVVLVYFICIIISFYLINRLSIRICINVFTFLMLILMSIRIDLCFIANEFSFLGLAICFCFLIITCITQLIYIISMINNNTNKCLLSLVLLLLTNYIIFNIVIIFFYTNLFNYINDYYSIKKCSNGFYTNANSLYYENSLDDNIYKGKLDNKNADMIRIPSLIYNGEYMVKGGKITSIKKDSKYTNKILISFWILKEYVKEYKKELNISFLSEYTYFSATTFYTVGYGDIKIIGGLPKIIAESEMFIAAALNIIFIPLFFYIIQGSITKSKMNRKQESNNENNILEGSNSEDDINKYASGDIIKYVNGIPIYYSNEPNKYL